VLSGTASKVAAGSDEETAAKQALFSKHPSFSHYPPGHAFFVAKLSITKIWLIDFYGGAKILSPEEYFNASSAATAPTGFLPRTPTHSARPVFSAVRGMHSSPPWFWQKAKTARWMVANLAWGVLSTLSTRSEGSTIGAPFGNPYSFADVGGVPYLYASDLDASMVDLFVGTGANTSASLALSEAGLPGQPLDSCKIGTFLGDPENPPCARLVLSGTASKVAAGSDEETAAKQALFSKHPSFSHYPPGHAFFVAKLAITGIWLIDMFGGAAIIKPSDYFSTDVPVTESRVA